MSAIVCALGEEQLALVAFDGKHFRLLSRQAFAPGQPLGVVAACEPPVALDLKSLGSVRRSDGTFEVRARAATLRREARAALLAHFSALPTR